MFRLLLLIPLLLLLSACAQETRGAIPRTYTTSHVSPYSLEALDARYHQRH